MFKYIIMRVVSGIFGTFGLYAAFDYLPMSLAITIYYTQPIFAAINCFFFLGERLSKLEIVSIFSAAFGMVVLT